MDQLKEAWNLAVSLGYSPWSFVASACAIFLVRKIWEPSPLDVNSPREMMIARLFKAGSMLSGFIVGYIAQKATAPGSIFGINFVSAIVDTVAGYAIWSIVSGIDPVAFVKRILPNVFGGGNPS